MTSVKQGSVSQIDIMPGQVWEGIDSRRKRVVLVEPMKDSVHTVVVDGGHGHRVGRTIAQSLRGFRQWKRLLVSR